MLLHYAQEFNDNLRTWSDQDLSLASLLRVIDAVECIVQNACSDHIGDGWTEILKSLGEI